MLQKNVFGKRIPKSLNVRDFVQFAAENPNYRLYASLQPPKSMMRAYGGVSPVTGGCGGPD